MILKDLETVSDRSMKKEQDEILNNDKQSNSSSTKIGMYNRKT